MMMRSVLTSVLFLSLIWDIGAQGLFRRGFSGQEDFTADIRLDEQAGASDMSREMFLMKDLNIVLPKLENMDGITDRKLRRHVQKYLGQSNVNLKLMKRRGRFGLKAIGVTEHNKKHLRAFWRPATPEKTQRVDFTKCSYDEAVRMRLPVMEFHVQLPPLKRGESLPTVVYQVPFDSGTINPKSMVPRTVGTVHVKKDDQEFFVTDRFHIGTGVTRNGVCDPSWAKGRAVFRPGRKSGL